MSALFRRLLNFRDWKLRTKFVLIFSVILALISVFIYIYFPADLERKAVDSVGLRAVTIAAMSAYNISPALYFDDFESLSSLLDAIKMNPDLSYMVVVNKADSICASYELDYAEKADYTAKCVDYTISWDGLCLKTKHYIFYNKKIIGKLYLGLSLQEVRDTVRQSRTYIAGISLLIFIIGMIFVILVSLYVTKPLGKIVETVEKISAGDYKQRSGIQSKDEVGVLAASFDKMVDRIVLANEELEAWNRNLEQRVAERTEKLEKEIQERKVVEESLSASEELNRGIVENSPIGILYLDKEGVIVYENKSMMQMMGVPADMKPVVIGKRIQDIPNIKEAGADAVIERLLQGELISGRQIEYKSLFGARKLLDVFAAPRFDGSGKVSGGILMCADITVLKDLEEQLRQAQKMEAVGTLAGGIAHDFNNILTGILGNVELAMMDVDKSSELYYLLMQVSNNAERAAELVAQLLAFGRRRMERLAPTNFNISIDEAVKFLQRTISPLIEIETAVEPNLKIVNADAGQVHQVLINLILNAVDSMPNGGKLVIKSANVSIDQEYCLSHRDAAEGEFVRISVKDSGKGIDPEIIDRIFEPFFTTKEVGKGSGLGLAMVYGILKGHKGWVEVESKSGQGSEFNLYFPAASSITEKKEAAQDDLPAVRGSGTVLIVDDELSVRSLGESMLKKYGYRVLTVEDGVEAVSMYRQIGNNIDLILLDLSMPRKSGRQTLQEILQINPQAKVVVTSGYDRQGEVQTLMDLGALDFVQKPFKMNSLLKIVQATLSKEM